MKDMTGGEKIQRVFSGKAVKKIPVVIPYTGIFIRDHWPQLTSCPWWYRESPDLSHQIAWHRDVITAISQDWFKLPGWFARNERRHMKIEVRSEGVFRVNKQAKEETELHEPVISDQDLYTRGVTDGYSRAKPEMPERLDAIDKAIPLTDDTDLDTFIEDGKADLAVQLIKIYGYDLYPIYHVGSPLWRCLNRWQFEDTMIKIILKPELVEYASRRFLAISKHEVKKASLLGVKAIWIEDAFTDMLNPKIFNAVNIPLLSQLVDEIRNAGMMSIYYFCGNPDGKWESILSINPDAISMEESKKNFSIDIENIVRHTKGRCVVLGNLDAVGVLQDGTDEQLRTEVARQLKATGKNDNRFIMSLGSPVTPGTPLHRVRYYCDLVREIDAGKEREF